MKGPDRASSFPEDAAGRKQHPVASGVMDYFPDALVAVSKVSWEGNNQHNPGQPLHWDRAKSTDEADAMIRHFLQRGSVDTDGIRHSAKMCWRALAFLQKEIEQAQVADGVTASRPLQPSEKSPDATAITHQVKRERVSDPYPDKQRPESEPEYRKRMGFDTKARCLDSCEFESCNASGVCQGHNLRSTR